MEDTITLTALRGSPHTLRKMECVGQPTINMYKVLSFEGTEKMGFTDSLQKYITLKGGPTLTVNKKIRGQNFIVTDILVQNKGLYVYLKKIEE